MGPQANLAKTWTEWIFSPIGKSLSLLQHQWCRWPRKGFKAFHWRISKRKFCNVINSLKGRSWNKSDVAAFSSFGTLLLFSCLELSFNPSSSLLNFKLKNFAVLMGRVAMVRDSHYPRFSHQLILMYLKANLYCAQCTLHSGTYTVQFSQFSDQLEKFNLEDSLGARLNFSLPF